jgi:hypothetical protein
LRADESDELGGYPQPAEHVVLGEEVRLGQPAFPGGDGRYAIVDHAPKLA